MYWLFLVPSILINRNLYIQLFFSFHFKIVWEPSYCSCINHLSEKHFSSFLLGLVAEFFFYFFLFYDLSSYLFIDLFPCSSWLKSWPRLTLMILPAHCQDYQPSCLSSIHLRKRNFIDLSQSPNIVSYIYIYIFFF